LDIQQTRELGRTDLAVLERLADLRALLTGGRRE
jgi:hypothetical protein